MNLPHPIPYQGSKRKLASRIVSCFPEDDRPNREGAARLFEPFAGSAAVSIAALASNRVGEVCLNDINAPLIALWDRIIHYPEELSEEYRALWIEQAGREREYYDFVRNEFNRTHQPRLFLYLLARCVKASIRYNAFGEFNQSPDNRRKGAHPDTMKRHIVQASRLLRGKTALSAGDYRIALKSAEPSDIVYLDPPYQGVCENGDPRYIETLSFDAFVGTLEELNERGISFVVSYDGRTGEKRFGRRLPDTLRLEHLEIHAGKSSQATLLGRDSDTYESLYLSPRLMERLKSVGNPVPQLQLSNPVTLSETRKRGASEGSL